MYNITATNNGPSPVADVVSTFRFTVTEFNDPPVLSAIAEHWDAGDSIQILYIPDRDYDSVIISTS